MVRPASRASRRLVMVPTSCACGLIAMAVPAKVADDEAVQPGRVQAFGELVLDAQDTRGRTQRRLRPRSSVAARSRSNQSSLLSRGEQGSVTTTFPVRGDVSSSDAAERLTISDAHLPASQCSSVASVSCSHTS